MEDKITFRIERREYGMVMKVLNDHLDFISKFHKEPIRSSLAKDVHIVKSVLEKSRNKEG